MRPSETDNGQEWIGNFDPHDQDAAVLLVDSMRFVTMTTMRQALATKLSASSIGNIEEPAMLVPERALTDFGVDPAQNPAAFRDFDPGAGLSVTPGSEGFIGSLIRDLIGREPDRWIPPGASLDDLKSRGCRSIVILSDFIGTGNRVHRLAAALRRNATIRSWHSFGWLRVHAVAYSGSPDSIRSLARAGSPVASVTVVESAPTLGATRWDDRTRDDIELVCRSYASNKSFALGYEASGVLFASDRGAPNNLPAIFWQRRPAKWKPLFPEKTARPDFVEQLGDYIPEAPFAELMERVNQSRLGRNDRIAPMRASIQDLVSVLASVRHGTRDVAEMAGSLHVPHDEVKGWIEALIQLGLVDTDRKLTALGATVLDAANWGRRRTTARLRGDGSMYYPSSLR